MSEKDLFKREKVEEKEIETIEDLNVKTLKDKQGKQVDGRAEIQFSNGMIFGKETKKLGYKELLKILKDTFTHWTKDHQILLPDRFFFLPNKKVIKGFNIKNKVDQQPYKSPVDCDDFAVAWQGHCVTETWLGGYATAELWFYHKEKNYGHALNLFVDTNKKVWIVEPQNDKIYEPKDYMIVDLIKLR